MCIRDRCNEGITFISCPTCGRTKIDLISLANRVEQRLSGIKAPLTVAVMGLSLIHIFQFFDLAGSLF